MSKVRKRRRYEATLEYFNRGRGPELESSDDDDDNNKNDNNTVEGSEAQGERGRGIAAAGINGLPLVMDDDDGYRGYGRKPRVKARVPGDSDSDDGAVVDTRPPPPPIFKTLRATEESVFARLQAEEEHARQLRESRSASARRRAEAEAAEAALNKPKPRAAAPSDAVQQCYCVTSAVWQTRVTPPFPPT